MNVINTVIDEQREIYPWGREGSCIRDGFYGPGEGLYDMIDRRTLRHVFMIHGVGRLLLSRLY